MTLGTAGIKVIINIPSVNPSISAAFTFYMYPNSHDKHFTYIHTYLTY